MRNHNTMKRDAIIKLMAGLVGQPHKVDLKNYDLLITVEIYQVSFPSHAYSKQTGERNIVAYGPDALTTRPQNICGVSVVDHRFEELKRYNIAEIFDPTPKEAPKEAVKDKKEKAEVRAEAVPTAVVDDNSGAAVTEAVHDVVAEGDGGVDVTTTDEGKDGLQSGGAPEAAAE